jgi:hypothetical protein
VKILYVINEDWFFVSHFLGIARRVRDSGHEVMVATRVRAHGAAIRAEGICLAPIKFDRGSFSLFQALASSFALYRLLRARKPDIVHFITAQSIVTGVTAAWLAGVPGVAIAPTGLGHLWIDRGLLASLGRQIVRAAVFLAGTMPNVVFFLKTSTTPASLASTRGATSA